MSVIQCGSFVFSHADQLNTPNLIDTRFQTGRMQHTAGGDKVDCAVILSLFFFLLVFSALHGIDNDSPLIQDHIDVGKCRRDSRLDLFRDPLSILIVVIVPIVQLSEYITYQSCNCLSLNGTGGVSA